MIMKVSTLLTVLCNIRAIPFQTPTDKLVRWNDVRVVVQFLLFIAASVLYIWLDILKQTDWSIQTVIVLICKILPLTGFPMMFVNSCLIVLKMQKLSSYQDVQLPYSLLIVSALTACTFYLSLLPLEITNSMDLTNWRISLKLFAFFWLILQNGVAIMTMFVIIELGLVLVKGLAIDKLNKEEVCLDDVVEVVEVWRTVSSSLQFPLLIVTIYNHLLAILSLYVFVKEPNIHTFALVIAAASTFLLAVIICHLLENVYEKLTELQEKTEEEALNLKCMQSMLCMKVYARRLTANVPLSALGYVYMDNTFITGMIGTVVTYLIILISF